MKTSSAFPIAALLFLLTTAAAASCVRDDGGGDNCRDMYDNSLVSECMDYRTFEFYACSPDEEMTDDACFINCIEGLADGEELCYDAERCTIDCSDDDATGCENAYYGMDNQQCLSYKEFYILACDPRGDKTVQGCIMNCYENEDGCDNFWDCAGECQE